MYGQGRRKLIVRLDFGTTHTGIKYAFEGDSYIGHVDCRPLANGAWVKNLDKLTAPTIHDNPRLIRALHDCLFRIVTDYMTEVLKFMVDFLAHTFHKNSVKGILDITPVEWWLVRPTRWSSHAVIFFQKIIETAAKDVKFYRTHFVTEADTAAFCALFEAIAHGELAPRTTVIKICPSSHVAVLPRLEEVQRPEELYIERRHSRFHTGILCGLRYKHDAHYQEDVYMYPWPFQRRPYTQNCIYWFSHKGDIIDEDSKRSGSFCISLKHNERSFRVDIVTTTAAEAPRRFYKSALARDLTNARLTGGDSATKLVSHIGELSVYIPSLMLQKYRKSTPDNEKGIRFHYVIEETMGSYQGSLIYRAFDALDKQPLGEVEVQLPVLE